MSKYRNITNRVISLYIIVLGVACGIFFKVFYIQKLDNSVSKINLPRFFKIEAPRGNIVADDGSLLAVSMPLYDAHLDMLVMDKVLFEQEVGSLSEKLSQLFEEKSPKDYELELCDAKSLGKRYHLLKNRVSHNELNELKRFPILKLGKNRGGLIAEQRPHRKHPFGLLAKRTIGILREDNPVGIERAYNVVLSGEDGDQLKQKIDGKQNLWRPEQSENNRFPIAGCDVITTINTDMQDVAEKALQKALIKHDASWGCVVLMEVENGAIKVIANLKRDADSLIYEYFNYAIGQHSEPGSTFKLASLISGLEDGLFHINDTVDTERGAFKFYDRTMYDSKKGGYGKISIGDAFVKSSNIGISKIINTAYKKNPTAFVDRIYKMGLSTPLVLELPFANNLIVKKPGTRGWSGVTLPWMSIGYEVQLTPLHILCFYNAIANKGKMVKPMFTDAIMKGGEVIEKHQTEVINPAICSQATIEQVIPLLKGVVEKGTAKNIKSNHYSIAGKTGTTELNYWKRKKDEQRRYQTSFVGFFPAENPKYSCIVVVNDPKGKYHYGGDVAAPIFKELSDKVFAFDVSFHSNIEHVAKQYEVPGIMQGNTHDAKLVLDKLNIESDITAAEWMIAKNNQNEVVLQIRKIKQDLRSGTMPDLTGMGIQDALYLLENYGIEVKYSGKGSIVSQSIKKGQQFHKGVLIKLELA